MKKIIMSKHKNRLILFAFSFIAIIDLSIIIISSLYNPIIDNTIITGGRTSDFWNVRSGGVLEPTDTSYDIRIPSLSSCDTIDTDVDGNFACGTDNSGGALALDIGSPLTKSSSGGIGMATSSKTADGFLLSSDWNIFNNKVSSSSISGFINSAYASSSFDVLGQATSTLLSHTATYNHANYDTAYGWGNHVGLYDILGQATSTLNSHTTTYNHANFLTSVASDADWTVHGSYPATCGVGEYVSAIGDTLTCSAPTFTIAADLNMGGYNLWNVKHGQFTDLTVTGTSSLIGWVGIGTTTPSANLMVQADGASTSADAAFAVKDINGNSLFRVSNDGKVGIGNKQPSALLDSGSGSTTAEFEYIGSPWLSSGVNQNFLVQTESFATTWTTQLGATVISNLSIDPRLGATAEILTKGTASTSGISQTIVNSQPGWWTFSIYIRATSTSNGSVATTTLRIEAGTIGIGSTSNEKIIELSDRWERHAVSVYAPGLSTWKRVLIYNGANTIQIWGAQLENSPMQRPYTTAITTTNRPALTSFVYVAPTLYTGSTISSTGAITSSAGLSGTTLALSSTFSGATTMAFSGAVTQSMIGLGSITNGTLGYGYLMQNTTVATAASSRQNSPTLNFYGNAWDGGVTRQDKWWLGVTVSTFTGAGNIATSSFTIVHSGTNAGEATTTHFSIDNNGLLRVTSFILPMYDNGSTSPVSKPLVNGQIFYNATSSNFIFKSAASGTQAIKPDVSASVSVSIGSSTWQTRSYTLLNDRPFKRVCYVTHCQVVGGTSKVINFSDASSAGTSFGTTTCATTNTWLTISNTSARANIIPINTKFFLQFGADTGAVDNLEVDLDCYYDPT